MNKKGIALAVVLVVVVVLSVIIVSLFARATHESNLARMHVNNIKAFWLAEAGLSEAFAQFSSVSGSINQEQGCLPGATCSYQAVIDSNSENNYYQIDSTGQIILSNGAQIERQLSIIVKIDPPDSNDFQYAIESTGDIVEKGNITIDPEDSKNSYANLNFSDLFRATKEQIKNNADYLYNENNFGEPVSGITWVEVSSGERLKTAGNLQGDGILIVEGDCWISGTENFDGIIYVSGELTITGTVEISGSVLAESGTEIDTELKGNVSISHDLLAIEEALMNIAHLNKEIAAWQQE